MTSGPGVGISGDDGPGGSSAGEGGRITSGPGVGVSAGVGSGLGLSLGVGLGIQRLRVVGKSNAAGGVLFLPSVVGASSDDRADAAQARPNNRRSAPFADSSVRFLGSGRFRPARLI